MEDQLSGILDRVFKASIVLLTLALVWFGFVYYPKITDRFKTQTTDRGIVGNVEASSRSLPYGNGRFRIQYLGKSNVYLVAISGATIEQYTQYRDEAELTLKNILSVDSLCGLNIAYSSNLPFSVPKKSPPGHC
jgi:hypothetical protein